MGGRKGVIVIGGCALGRFFLGNWCAAKLWASLWNPYQVIPFAEGYGDEGKIVQIWKGHISGLIGYIKILRITPIAGGAELLIWTSRRESLKQLLIVVYSIVSSRALLNIKEIASRESAELQRNDLTLESGNPI
ncbi:hypothetical protein C8J57DRAFT_1250583 [Mycena rebaudengoi]|nr:hypothetical protein C8J57DRAFT_1250583 [Mycena rebaudengoi]